MIEVVIYFFLALKQGGEGVQAGSFGKLEECEMVREQVMSEKDTLAVSQCLSVKLKSAEAPGPTT